MNNFVGNNINAIRVHYGYSQEQFANAIKVRQTTVSSWECGESIPRQANVAKILDAIPDIQIDDIMSDERGFAKRVHRSAATFIDCPLYGSVAAGTPIEMIEIEDMKQAPSRYVSDDPDAFLVRVRGNSMSRLMQDGNYALVSPRYVEPNEHDVFLVTVNGDDATIKRVRRLANGIELIPDSYDPTYRPMVYDFGDEDTPPIRILGKVVWWCHEF